MVEHLEQQLQKDGIKGISGAIFEDICVPLHINSNGVQKANTTPRQFCEDMGKLEGVTADEYAAEILRVLTSPKTVISGECQKCMALLEYGEPHVCKA